MNVLLLAWDFPPGKGGIQLWMGQIARRLPDSDVIVLAPATGVAAPAARIRRLRGARFGIAVYLGQLALATALACLRRRPDVIVCGHLLTAPAALLTRLLLRVPYVVFVYGWEIRRPLHSVARLALQRATLVAACSRFTAEAVVALGVPRSRVRVAYPGVDTTRFSPRPDPELLGSSEPRAQSPEPPRLLTVSRLHERYKGHDTVIRALPLVLARHPGTRYVIVGDGPLRAYLARLAQSLGVEQAVRFRGEEPDDLLPSLYRACDVFVQLSREALVGGGAEGFGIACLEAAACGKPVVAGRSGGLPDAVQDGTTGVLVDPDDVADAADAIVALLDDAERARRLGEAGRARVLERFTWDHVLAQARRVFEEACASSS